jgi:phage terminase large subunit-like protein
MNKHEQFWEGSAHWSRADLDLYAHYYAAQAREDFWAYRRFMDPQLKVGWWVRDISYKLQLFYQLLIAGARPKLITEAPPQHGKSRTIIDFCAWLAGKAPDCRQIYASFSSDLGLVANSQVQRQIDSDNYKLVFPHTTISTPGIKHGDTTKPKRTSNFIEFIGHKGSFRNTTVNGQITGKGLDFGVVDDPIKGRSDASSKLKRDKAWSWLIDDFMSRFSDDAGMILTATRWHVDDPTGRFVKHFADAIVLKYPALSVTDGRTYDPRKRPDLPLFPQFKSYSFLQERKAASTSSSWESLYQQSPVVQGGNLFPIDRVKIINARPADADIEGVVRYWDKAGSTDAGAYTVGVRMLQLKSGGWLIDDVVRGQWAAFERERQILATAERDAAAFDHITTVGIYVEQEPGSGGKESAERTIANLAGHSAHKDKVTGSKLERADPYMAQWQGGNINLYYSDRWNDDFLDEHEIAPNGKYMDQIDAAAGAFAKLVNKKYRYDSNLDWIE